MVRRTLHDVADQDEAAPRREVEAALAAAQRVVADVLHPLGGRQGLVVRGGGREAVLLRSVGEVAGHQGVVDVDGEGAVDDVVDAVVGDEVAAERDLVAHPPLGVDPLGAARPDHVADQGALVGVVDVDAVAGGVLDRAEGDAGPDRAVEDLDAVALLDVAPGVVDPAALDHGVADPGDLDGVAALVARQLAADDLHAAGHAGARRLGLALAHVAVAAGDVEREAVERAVVDQQPLMVVPGTLLEELQGPVVGDELDALDHDVRARDGERRDGRGQADPTPLCGDADRAVQGHRGADAVAARTQAQHAAVVRQCRDLSSEPGRVLRAAGPDQAQPLLQLRGRPSGGTDRGGRERGHPYATGHDGAQERPTIRATRAMRPLHHRAPRSPDCRTKPRSGKRRCGLLLPKVGESGVS